MKHTNMKLFGLTFQLLSLSCATASFARRREKTRHRAGGRERRGTGDFRLAAGGVRIGIVDKTPQKNRNILQKQLLKRKNNYLRGR